MLSVETPSARTSPGHQCLDRVLCNHGSSPGVCISREGTAPVRIYAHNCASKPHLREHGMGGLRRGVWAAGGQSAHTSLGHTWANTVMQVYRERRSPVGRGRNQSQGRQQQPPSRFAGSSTPRGGENRCRFPQCPYAHLCHSCHAPHPAAECGDKFRGPYNRPPMPPRPGDSKLPHPGTETWPPR